MRTEVTYMYQSEKVHKDNSKALVPEDPRRDPVSTNTKQLMTTKSAFRINVFSV